MVTNITDLDNELTTDVADILMQLEGKSGDEALDILSACLVLTIKTIEILTDDDGFGEKYLTDLLHKSKTIEISDNVKEAILKEN